jgi:hypothetical protein
MAVTGESYQQALSRLLDARRRAAASTRDVDLIPIEYFGIPVTLATFEILGDLSCVALSGGRFPLPVPKSPLFALARRSRLS